MDTAQILLCALHSIVDLAHDMQKENYKAEIVSLREQLAEKDRLLTSSHSEISNNPLTLQEVLDLKEPTPLWIEGDFTPHWELVEWIPVTGGSQKLQVESLHGESDCVCEADIRETYGSWRYYRLPPDKTSL